MERSVAVWPAVSGIVVDDHATREAAEQLDLRLGKAGAATGHHVADSGARNRNGVHVAFDQHREIAAAQRFLRAIQVIQHVALRIDRRFGRIQILGHVVAQGAAPEGDDFSGFIRNGERNAAAKAIEHAAVLTARDQALIPPELYPDIWT